MTIYGGVSIGTIKDLTAADPIQMPFSRAPSEPSLARLLKCVQSSGSPPLSALRDGARRFIAGDYAPQHTSKIG